MNHSAHQFRLTITLASNGPWLPGKPVGTATASSGEQKIVFLALRPNAKNVIMSKKILLSALLSLTFLAAGQAQRFVIVDINAILEKLPEYQQAQKELDEVASTWRQQIAEEYDKIKSMYNKYQAEQVLLSDEARTQREEEIIEKENQVREMQREKFGPEGALFRKRQELVQPIQEKVYKEIESFASDRGFDFIFDKSGNAGLIFYNPEYDKTEDVMRRMGINK